VLKISLTGSAIGEYAKSVWKAFPDVSLEIQARPFYEKLGYRVFGTLENHPVGHQHYFMTKKLDFGE